MKTQPNYTQQSKEPRSILEMTPFEIFEADAWQDRNRNFIDDDGCIPLENLEEWGDD